MYTLRDFKQISGHKINKEKAKVIRIGGWGDNRAIPCKDLNLKWTQEFVSLGITYDIDNFDNITDLIINLKKTQKYRNLYPYGMLDF